MFADTVEIPSIDSSVAEKQKYIESLQSEEIEANSNAVVLADVQQGSIQDITVDSSDVIFGFAQLREMLDGAGALDPSTGNGYDSSLNNRVVRTHDSITYQLGYGLQLSENLNENVYQKGKLYVRLTLPVTSDKAQFDEKALDCISNKSIQEANGQQIITGEYILPKNDQSFSIPCAGRIDVVVNIIDMVNGSSIQPRFELSSKSGIYEKTIIPPSCEVTCRGAYAISTASHSCSSTRQTKSDYQGISHTGVASYVCDIKVDPIMKDGTIKKGLYFPKDVKFDVNYSVTEDNAQRPIDGWIRDFGIRANQGTYTSDFGTYTQYLDMPTSRYVGSGSISISSHKKFTITLNNIPRSGGVCRVILLGSYPNIGDSVTMRMVYENTRYNDNGWKSTIESDITNWSRSWHETYPGAWVDYFAFTSHCDLADSQKRMHCMYDNGHKDRQLHSGFEEGDTRVSRGDEVMMIHEIDISGITQVNMSTPSINMYTFCDANCFEVLEQNSMGVKPHVSCCNADNFFNTSSQKIFYIAKKNGTNWTSQAEMSQITVDNVGLKIKVYSSLQALKNSGAVCVGVMCELRGFSLTKYNTTGAVLIDVPVKIKSTAVPKSTYMISGGTILWVDDNIPSHMNNWSTTPSRDRIAGANFKANMYRKTEFNDKGEVTRTHNDARDGQTVWINPLKATIKMEVAQKENGLQKNVYKYSEGDKFVWFKITPGYKGILAGNNTWTYTVTLPTGLKIPTNHFLPGQDWAWVYYGGTFSDTSIYGENGSVAGGTKITPTILQQSNPGNTIFAFSKTFSQESDFKPFYIKVEIDGNYVANGRNYTANATVTGDNALKVDEKFNNQDKAGMITVLKNSVTLAKTGLSSVEYGDSLRYSLHITNQGTTVRNMQIKDFLPGSFSQTDSQATYSLTGLRWSHRQGEYTYGDSDALDASIMYRRVGDSNTDMSTWVSIPQSEINNGISRKNISAIGLKGTLNPGMSIVIDVELSLTDETMGDIFYNGFIFEGENFPEPIRSNLVKTIIPVRTAKLTIEKKLKSNSYVSSKGEYIFHYKISSLDNDRSPQVTYYKTLKVSSGTSASITFECPARVYKIEELGTNDWSINSKFPGVQSYLLNPVSDWRTIGKSPSVSFTGTQELYAKLNTGGTGKVTFTNQGSFKDYTHNNEVKNLLK